MAHSPATPIDELLTAIPSLPRPVLDRLVTSMIDHLDVLDGDPDVELNGDERDGSFGEDDFVDFSIYEPGPGCPVSDPGGCEHDGREPEDHEDYEEYGRPPEGARKSREAHRRRIRSTRCRPVYYRTWGGGRAVNGYELIREPVTPSLRELRRRHRQLRRGGKRRR